MDKTSIIAAIVGAVAAGFLEGLKVWGKRAGETAVPTTLRYLPRVLASVPLKWSATAYYLLWWLGLAFTMMELGLEVRLLTAIGLLITALCLAFAADRIRHDTLVGMGWLGVVASIGAIAVARSDPGFVTGFYYLVGAILFTVSLNLRKTWHQEV
jgi:hypothetical protein